MPKLDHTMNWSVITIWAMMYTLVLINIDSFSLPQTTKDLVIQMPNMSAKINQSFGNVYDVDVVMQSFLPMRAKINYVRANYRIFHKALYPKHRHFHYFVQILIYNNYHCSVSWSELNALFMIFPSETMEKLGWELSTAFGITNRTKVFNPCSFKGVSCMLHQNTSLDDIDNQYHDITYVGSYYISEIAVNSHGRFFKNDANLVTVFLNYSLPQYLIGFTLIASKIYEFSFAKMPKDLQSFTAVACIFYNMTDQSFLWNSMPHAIEFLEISESMMDINSTRNVTWTSIARFKDVDGSLNLSTNFDDLEFIPTWYKPKLKHFVIRDFKDFRNDPNTFNVNQFLLHIPVIAPSLNQIHLNMLDLNGFVYVEQVKKALNPDSRSTTVKISLFKSGLDMIGYGLISCGIEVDHEYSIHTKYDMREMQLMHVFENFERFFKCQQLMFANSDQPIEKYKVEHQLLSYDDVMEGYDMYQTVSKSNVSEVDVQISNSFQTIVNIENQHQQRNNSKRWVLGHHRFMRHCVLPAAFQKSHESHSSFVEECIPFLVIVAIVCVFIGVSLTVAYV